MKTIEFVTNIMCGSCIAKVTPVFNKEIGEGKWKVDTLNPKKILTVSDESLDENDIIRTVQKAGYKAEALK
ncbi:MAG: heavy-metal-associated domain-containing protein [Ginsengibacter sp.]